ncbi:FxsA cytoplasmic membrane protein [Bacteriovorax sp. BSW11_IV]|uniref:FxsA family protein n=1 Tax=Bacteriovorax sp. BSW11_IV TaxID=1353529 RepID=UPI00038A2E3F|nr:FxsA family protein [Bacteriovorax sp. BSW11_IV]EQC43026.1 FxsA cytoplasmic membrane protein [Bacteriovorax sp. BSW11_IV]
MFLPLVFLFTLLPALEIYLLFSIGGEIGGINTLIIVLTTGFVGAGLARSQGLSILAEIQQKLQTGAIPAQQIIHGLMIFAGGLLLMTPGFVTDIMGLAMVVPGSRHILAAFAQKYFAKAIQSGNVQFSTFGMGRGGGFSYNSYENGTNYARPNGPRQVAPDTFEAEFHEKK